MKDAEGIIIDLPTTSIDCYLESIGVSGLSDSSVLNSRVLLQQHIDHLFRHAQKGTTIYSDNETSTAPLLLLCMTDEES